VREDEQLSDLVDVFVAHRNQLCQVATKILGSLDRAEDVVQDAYLKVIEARAVFVVKQPVAYIFRIVRNLAIDHYRRATLESGVFTVAEEGWNGPSASGTPEAISISRQQLSLVASALDQLPERTRRAFELYRMGGHTQREIAQMLDVSPSLVNFMIRDALDHCRSALESTF
jgi:RNA polymerase sigma-70 factor (ECF subfamily)